MEQKIITGPDDLYLPGTEHVGWLVEPIFQFETEIDALRTLSLLGEDLATARQQVNQIMRYLEAAAKAAHAGTAKDGKVAPQAIINESGLARQTIYNWIEPTKSPE
ncbi:hypothetical protein [Nocardia gipuzkoensis]|uniref:hypothetical protein n=1 Tax=Nocardia gipuzkoensis TaxID=2749991 RepID=UPI00237D3BEB|nr:hypothetical protein [Nocardia gipuzkoensis]MDE1675134.1 hypothetical protein [Nocardia gipuzkoensis]